MQRFIFFIFAAMNNTDKENSLKKIISHAKEYGFIFPSSEIYDGLSAVYDYGQNGVNLKNNIKERLQFESDGSIKLLGRAIAIKGICK